MERVFFYTTDALAQIANEDDAECVPQNDSRSVTIENKAEKFDNVMVPSSHNEFAVAWDFCPR